MNYKKIYYKLCLSRKIRDLKKEGGYEIHHIIPRSMGGDDTDSNLVKLTYREHFIAHKLLFKFTTEGDKVSMAFALSLMSSKNTIKTSKAYDESTSYLKYTNRIVLRKDKGYVYMEYLKLTTVGINIKHESFAAGSMAGSRRLSALYFICKEMMECGIEGIVSVNRSSWKHSVRKLEDQGFFDTYIKEGRKFYKFNKSAFENKEITIKNPRNIPFYKLLPASHLYGTVGLLRAYNKENPCMSVIVEESHVDGRYYILPVVSGWIPSEKALNTKKDVLAFLRTDE